MSKLNYSTYEEITVKSQAELDAIPLDYKGTILVLAEKTNNKPIIIKNRYDRAVEAHGDSLVEACGNSSVVAKENSFVRAKENSFVRAQDNSSVVAQDNSSVVAWGNSSVVAWGNSSVVAKEHSQVDARETSSIEAWDSSFVEAQGNSYVFAGGNSFVETKERLHVEAKDHSFVEASGNSFIEAYENSSVMAYGNSSIEAYENSHIEARENSSVVARELSSVSAYGNSSVSAFGYSSVVAWEDSSVEACGNSSVVAQGNSQIVDRTIDNNIKINGNARIVYNPNSINEFINFHMTKQTKTKAIFYKAVKKVGDKYLSYYNNSFEYVIGKTKKEYCNSNTDIDCGSGIHISNLQWALDFGRDWDDLAILEVETKIEDIVLPKGSDGKVRTSKIKVLREVPLEECGIYGKILADRKRTKCKEDKK